MMQLRIWISIAFAFSLLSTQSALSQTPVGISIVAPEDFSIVAGTVPVVVDVHAVTESDLSARFFVDGVPVGLSSKPPYTFNLNSVSQTNGWHIMMVVLVDRKGAVVATAMISVVVNNAAGETFRKYLLPKEAEFHVFGLYTYLLIPRLISDQNASSYRRIIASIDAFFVVPSFSEKTHLYIPYERLNMAYIPLRRSIPDDREPAKAIIENYNYSRAYDWLTKLKDQRFEGPYIVSCRQPLSTPLPDQAGERGCMVLDLSNVPQSSIKPLVELYFRQADSGFLWGNLSLSTFVIGARVGLARLAQPLDDPTIMKSILAAISRK